MSVPIVFVEHPESPVKHWLSFYYGDERIVVERTAKVRQVPRLLIKVDPDCRVLVQAPANASDEKVLQALKARGRWIHQQLIHFRDQLAHVTPRQYISGETHYYLGKQYVLKVIEAPGEVQQVRLLRGMLEVSVRQRSELKVRELMHDWYKNRAREVFARRLQAALMQALWVSQEPPLRIQTMQTQWGSCSPNGRITLNPHLVKAPRICIDYVVLHELCHIVEHNHSERFYRLMTQVMPQWKRVKGRLDGMAAVLLNGVF